MTILRRLLRTLIYIITGRDMKAVTLFGCIILLRSRGELLDMLGAEGYRRLWLHELEHKRQQLEEGFKFYPKYIYYYFKLGYFDNPYEAKAREAEKAP